MQGKKSDEENAFCSAVSLTSQEVKSFFEKSKIIDAKTMHDKYNELPCSVYGTLRFGNNSCQWEIQAGGTGLIQCPDVDYVIGCDNCDDFLKD